MLSSLKKMRGDKKGWYKVSDLVEGTEIAVPSETSQLVWDEIVSITPVGREQVYDIEVEGTHNFVGNDIFAHNTYVLRANTMLAVTGEVNAGSFTVPIGSQGSQTSNSNSGSLTSEIPAEVLTAGGKGVDLYKLSTYNLATTTALAAMVEEERVRVTSLETRVDALESGAVGSQTSNASSGSLTSSLASALSDLGVLIQRGIAQFNTLVFRQLVASSDADGTSSAGSVSILTGNTVAQVANSLVLPSTKVFVTFNSSVTGSWWVADKTAGSFSVVLSAPQASDVSFDYFLVQTEGQLQTSDARASEIGSSTPSSVPQTSPTVQPPQSSPEATTGTATSSLPSDTIPPVVTLIGDAALQINVGDVFTDPGATATDPSTDSGQATDLTSQIVVTGTVDTATAGSYTLTYTATDAAGNSASVSRLITVVAPVAPAPEPAPEVIPTPII